MTTNATTSTVSSDNDLVALTAAHNAYDTAATQLHGSREVIGLADVIDQATNTDTLRGV